MEIVNKITNREILTYYISITSHQMSLGQPFFIVRSY